MVKPRSGIEAVGEGFKHPTGGGRPLQDCDRRFFEPRFGWDFSKVRIHSGYEASVAARSVNALAYTTRNDVVFGEGQSRPGTEGGSKLLAHELTHTIQQAGGGAPEIQRQDARSYGRQIRRRLGTRSRLRQRSVYSRSGSKGKVSRKL